MKKIVSLVVLTSLSILLFTGCVSGRFNGSFQVTNSTSRLVYVSRLEGFETQPITGVFGPGSRKVSYMEVIQSIPEYCDIVWWYALEPGDYFPGEREQNTRVSLAHIPKNQPGTLILTLKESSEWEAIFDPE